MTSTTWASPRYVQELATILGPQNRTQERCGVFSTYFGSISISSFFNRPQFKNVKLASHIFCSQVDIIRSWSCNDVMMMIVSNAITV